MRQRALGPLAFALCVIVGASLTMFLGRDNGSSSQEDIVRQTFRAIQKHDWAKLRRIAVTTAELEAKANGMFLVDFKESYLGTEVHPTEIKTLHNQFGRAISEEDGQLDFGTSELVGIGSVVAAGIGLTPGGQSFDYTTVSMTLVLSEGLIDSRELQPRLILVPWGNEYRLLGFDFDDQELSWMP